MEKATLQGMMKFLCSFIKKNKKMKNLLTVASEEKQYINFDNN